MRGPVLTQRMALWKQVAVYDYGLSPSRIASHTKALSTHTGQVVVNPEAEGSLFEAEGSLSEAEGSLFFSGGNRPYASSESGTKPCYCLGAQYCGARH